MKFKCTCKHESQDKLHGKDVRVFNECISKGSDKTYRCTVCSSIKSTK